MLTADSLIKYKGIGDILVAIILVCKPEIIYDSAPPRILASWTGLVSFIVFSTRLSYSNSNV